MNKEDFERANQIYDWIDEIDFVINKINNQSPNTTLDIAKLSETVKAIVRKSLIASRLELTEEFEKI